MYDVLIVGGGITGTAIARELSRYDLKVALAEKHPDVAMGATKANSAIVHGGYAEAHAKLKGRLCYQGRRRFAQLDAELHFGFKPIGSFVLAFEENQREGLQALLENGRLNGLSDLAILSREQILEREPHVNPEVKCGLWCEGAGVCSPYELAIALAENAVANGVDLFLDAEIAGIERREADFAVAAADGRKWRTRFVVNAAGLDAARVAALAGESRYAIRPRSGEYLLMNRGSGDYVNSVLFQMPTKMGKGILVTPTVYGNLLIGPDAIDEELDDRDTHPDRLLRIFRAARLTCPELGLERFLRSFAGVRAVSSTDDFIVDAGTVPGFVDAAGIQSPGMTSSPAVAERVRDLLADAGLALKEKPDFNPERRAVYVPHEFLPPAQLAPLLALPEGADGRMVCRCEQVAEATLREASRRGVPVRTVDGVKRRTRAGMGFCQGDFCRPRVLAWFAAQGIDPFDDKTDAERDGLRRVDRAAMLAYAKENGEGRKGGTAE